MEPSPRPTPPGTPVLPKRQRTGSISMDGGKPSKIMIPPRQGTTAPVETKKKKSTEKTKKKKDNTTKSKESSSSSSASSSREYKCPHCPEVFDTKSTMDQHVRRHDLDHKYVCNICTLGFPQQTQINNHEETHYSVSLWECPYCIHTAKNKCAVNHHIWHVHTDQMHYECKDPTCGHVFKPDYKQELTRLMDQFKRDPASLHHEDPRSSCLACGKLFTGVAMAATKTATAITTRKTASARDKTMIGGRSSGSHGGGKGAGAGGNTGLNASGKRASGPLNYEMAQKAHYDKHPVCAILLGVKEARKSSKEEVNERQRKQRDNVRTKFLASMKKSIDTAQNRIEPWKEQYKKDEDAMLERIKNGLQEPLAADEIKAREQIRLSRIHQLHEQVKSCTKRYNEAKSSPEEFMKKYFEPWRIELQAAQYDAFIHNHVAETCAKDAIAKVKAEIRQARKVYLEKKGAAAQLLHVVLPPTASSSFSLSTSASSSPHMSATSVSLGSTNILERKSVNTPPRQSSFFDDPHRLSSSIETDEDKSIKAVVVVKHPQMDHDESLDHYTNGRRQSHSRHSSNGSSSIRISHIHSHPGHSSISSSNNHYSDCHSPSSAASSSTSTFGFLQLPSLPSIHLVH